MPRMKTVVRILGGAVLCLAGVVMWSFADKAGSPGAQAALFGGAAACLAGALWPRWGIALLLAGIMAMALDPSHLARPTAGNIAFVVLTAVGAARTLRRFPVLACLAASFPCFALGKALPPMTAVALALAVGGLVIARVRPLLSHRRPTGVTPLPHLAHGPVTAAPERVFEFRKNLGVLTGITVLLWLAALAGTALILAGRAQSGFFLALPASLLGATFSFSLWWTKRVRFRLDAKGIHSRVMFGETSIAWNEVGALRIRDTTFLTYGARFRYFSVLSPDAEITFPETMEGAAELRESVERATGMKWPSTP
jgi:hypothetical protein